jgi:dipeptidase E
VLELTALPSVKLEDWVPAVQETDALSAVFPHLDREDGIPASPLAEREAWAAGLSVPAYAIDDQTAIKVTDGTVEVVSEGHWKRFTANESR